MVRQHSPLGRGAGGLEPGLSHASQLCSWSPSTSPASALVLVATMETETAEEQVARLVGKWEEEEERE